MRSLRSLSLALATVSFLAFNVPSHAVTISQSDPTNNPYVFNWSFSSAAGPLTGTGSLTVSGWGTQYLLVGVSLNNTSALSSNRLTSFGFGIDPNAASVTFIDSSDGGMINASLDQIPSLKLIEVCAFGGQNCSGGANGGIYGGASDSFALRLSSANGTLWGTSVVIDPIGFKYQTNQGSFEFTTTPPGGSVPEPGPLALFSVGLLGLALRRRRTNGL